MVLVSLHPRRLQKALFALAAGFGLLGVPCFAQALLFTVPSTPYDGQMLRVARVLKAPASSKTDANSLVALNSWMSGLRAMPYQYSPKWKTPRELRVSKSGDCKGKAVALYDKLRAHGARNVRLVIGKHRIEDSRTHAWVEWQTANGNLLLDPTFNWAATRTNEQDPFNYVPLYAYDSGHKYRAFNPLQVTQHSALSTQVASGGR